MPIHKKLIRGAIGLLPGGGTALTAFDIGGGGSAPAQMAKFTAAQLSGTLEHLGHGHTRVSTGHAWMTRKLLAEAQLFGRSRERGGTFAPNASTTDCGFGRVWDEVRGKCVFGLGAQAGRDDTPIGDAVMGRYGAAMVPGNHVINRAVCLPGMIVGDDGLCYNRGQITNTQRAWPRGRKPLLTGGEMRAISVAATAGRRLERATKRLQKIGLMKKPAARKQIRSGPTEHHHHT